MRAKFVSRISPWRYTSSRERVPAPLASWQKQPNLPACVIQQDIRNMFQPGLCTWKQGGSSRVSRQCSEVPLLMLLLIEWSHFPASSCWAVTVGRAACFTSALPRVHMGRKGIQLVSFLWMQTAQSAAKSPEIHLRKQGDTKIMYSHQRSCSFREKQILAQGPQLKLAWGSELCLI